eukprot:4848510-Amphidinium_carterae.1
MGQKLLKNMVKWVLIAAAGLNHSHLPMKPMREGNTFRARVRSRTRRVRVLRAVEQNGRALLHAAEELKGDREIVLKAVEQNGWALQFAAEELKGDRAIVLAAVEQNALTLQLAAEELQGDREIVLKAVEQNG